MGLACFRLNCLVDADRYLSLAVALCDEASVEDDRELIFHCLRARSFLALPFIFRGHFSESKALLLETLELCDQLAPHHPDKAVIINSLGLVHERSGEDQDMAFHFYKQSLVERKRYAIVAPGDMVPTLNNVAMQYSRRGDYDQALVLLEEAADIRRRDSRWHYHTALTEQHIGQVQIQKGDFAEAERHLQEAATVYAHCTPYHDVRGKVAVCLAHLYITKPLRNVRQARHYLQQVCDLAENSGEDLSDSGLVVLMEAIQHRAQLDGWAKATVLPRLEEAQQRISRFDGDSSKPLAQHRGILSNVITLLQSGFSEEQKEAVTQQVMEQCQLCGYLSITQDTRSLWREVEKSEEERRTMLKTLYRSPIVTEVLKLAGHHPSDSASPSTQKQVPEVQQLDLTQTPPSVNTTDKIPPHEQLPCLHSTSGRGRTDQELGSINQQLHRVVSRLLRPAPEREQGVEETHSEHRQPFPHQNVSQYHENRAKAEIIREFCAGVQEPMTDRNAQHSVQATMGTRNQMMANDQYSSCAFTSSHPPSTRSELTSTGSPESIESGYRHQHEAVTYCERFIIPHQETARDQHSEGLNSATTAAGSIHISVPDRPFPRLADQSSRQHLPEAGYFGTGTTSPGYKESDKENVSSAESSRFSHFPSRSGFSQLQPTSHESERRAGDGQELSPHGHSSPSSAQPPSSSAPLRSESQCHVSSSPASPLTPQSSSATSSRFSASVPSASQGTASENLATSPDVARPQVTLERVVTCAQQLRAVLPSTDVVTSEQRMMLEKLASLTTPKPESSSPPGAHLTEQTLQNLITIADQAAILSVFRSQRPQTKEEPCQSQNRTQQPGQSQSVMHSPHPVPTTTCPSNQPQPVAQSPDLPGFQRLHEPQRGAQPFLQTQSAARVLNPAALQDQLEAFSKLSRTAPKLDLAQNQPTEVPPIKELDKESPTLINLVQGDRVYAEGFRAQVVKPPCPSNKQGDGRIAATTHGQAVLSDNTRVTHFTGFPEAQQETESTTLHATTAGSVTSGATGTSSRSSQLSSTHSGLSASSVSASELCGTGRRREPIESDESAELQGFPPVSKVEGPPRLFPPNSREATENDERLDNPHHVCTSADCCCSLKPDS